MVFRKKMLEINKPFHENLMDSMCDDGFRPELSLFIVTDEGNHWITEEDNIYFNDEAIIYLEEYILWEKVEKIYLLIDEQE